MIRSLLIALAIPCSALGQVVIIEEPTKTPPVAASSLVPTDLSQRSAVLSPTAPPGAPSSQSKRTPSSTAARPAVQLTSTCATGYCWKMPDGSVLNESWVAYRARTGKLPPEAARQCSTGFCGTFDKGPTLATGGCTCGCDASLCGCHHSKNAGKPLASQKVEPSKAASTSGQSYSAPRWRLFGRWRG